MSEEDLIVIESSPESIEEPKNEVAVVDDEKENKVVLKQEDKEIIDRIITEKDPAKVKDLTYLFNLNQNKKNIMRNAKLNDLLDVITDQALERFSARPDEISNKELLDSMKVVQDSIEKNTKAISGTTETPLIQINQQTNEVNIQTGVEALDRDSRERVKDVIAKILAGATKPEIIDDGEIIDVSEPEIVDEPLATIEGDD